MKVGTMVNEIKADEDAVYAEFAELRRSFYAALSRAHFELIEKPFWDAAIAEHEAADAPTIVDAPAAPESA